MKLRIGLTVMAALVAGTLAAQEAIKVRKLDFPLPEGWAEELPQGVTADDVYVTDDNCFYYKKDGQFHFFNCIG